ncbi:hypothetical protein PQX77_000360 [Marasmius sp. AFHP31]|nr:hypothetical protein PQX77_000360 [Marasmius sp. AFHP31]
MSSSLRSLYSYVFNRGNGEDEPRQESPQFRPQEIGVADPIHPQAPPHSSPLRSSESLHPNPQPQSSSSHPQPQKDGLPPQQGTDITTENRGNYNQTNNGSHILHSDGVSSTGIYCQQCLADVEMFLGYSNILFTIFEREPETTPVSSSSSATNSSPSSVTIASPPSSTSTSLSSENNAPASSIPAALASSRADTSTIHGDDRTPGQLYASLLSTCRLGYPLWKPSPRCTAAGKEYLINIGDVGVCSDLDPFHTLFNITYGEQVPEDVDPLCDLEEDITVDARYHPELKILAKPKGAISEQREQSSVFTFTLSEKEGALLMLPRGGVLKKLQNTHIFKTRIQSYWRQWYKFAEETGDLDESQTLCLLTGIERCSTWAMAGWDAKSGHFHTDPDSLKLTVDKVSGQCLWSFPPARCWTQSTLTPTPIHKEPKETVFIRGIWINRMNGNTSASPSPPRSSDNEDGSDGGEDPRGRGRHSRNPYNRSQRATYFSQNPRNPFCNGSSSNPFSSTRDSHSDCDHTVHSGSRPSPPDVHQLNEGNTIDLSAAAFDMVTHPCRLINKLALELISQIQLPLLDSGCVALSQDEDWMSVSEDSDEEAPSGTELLRRICGKLKFVAEGGAIYTEIMNTTELEHIQQSIGLLESSKSESVVIPVLFHLRDPGVSHIEGELAGTESLQRQSRSSAQDLPGGSDAYLSDSKKQARDHESESLNPATDSTNKSVDPESARTRTSPHVTLDIASENRPHQHDGYYRTSRDLYSAQSPSNTTGNPYLHSERPRNSGYSSPNQHLPFDRQYSSYGAIATSLYASTQLRSTYSDPASFYGRSTGHSTPMIPPGGQYSPFHRQIGPGYYDTMGSTLPEAGVVTHPAGHPHLPSHPPAVVPGHIPGNVQIRTNNLVLSSNSDISDLDVENQLRRLYNIPFPQPVNLHAVPDPPAPPFTLIAITQIAIWSSPERRLTQAQIWTRIEQRFHSDTVKNWKANIRHLLSLKKTFVKLPESKNGAHYWALDYRYLESGGDKRVRKRGARARKVRDPFDITRRQGDDDEDDTEELQDSDESSSPSPPPSPTGRGSKPAGHYSAGRGHGSYTKTPGEHSYNSSHDAVFSSELVGGPYGPQVVAHRRGAEKEWRLDLRR